MEIESVKLTRYKMLVSQTLSEWDAGDFVGYVELPEHWKRVDVVGFLQTGMCVIPVPIDEGVINEQPLSEDP